MNSEKMTRNVILAINRLESLAQEYSHQMIDVSHLLMSLVVEDDSLINSILQK